LVESPVKEDTKIDKIVKSLKFIFFVILAKTLIYYYQ